MTSWKNFKHQYDRQNADMELHRLVLTNAMGILLGEKLVASAAAVAVCWDRCYPGEPLPTVMQALLTQYEPLQPANDNDGPPQPPQ